MVFSSVFEDLPVEVCSQDSNENIIDKVRAHFADLEQGETQDRELKVFVLGNAGVGKTQLCRRLRKMPFDPSEPSTHGIKLGHLEESLEGEVQPVRLNLWDFGGQDIYHGSHSLFLQGQAVFLLLWTPDREGGTYKEAGVRLYHRPLAYWLDWVRNLVGTDSPVLVVQSQCDYSTQRQLPNWLPIDSFRYLYAFEFSAFTDLGLDLLRAHIKEGVRDVLTRHPPVAIGQGRGAVRNHLRSLVEGDQTRPAEQRQHRTLNWEAFENICRESGNVSSPAALLDYLHHAGVVFYRSGLFDNRIILDQTWALDAIYTLFHRERTLSVFYRNGRFTRRELELLIWGTYSFEEQQLFLSMMESCEICFRARNLSKNPHDPEWEYVAPELLPQWSEVQDQLLGRLQDSPPDAEARLQFHFLHEGILRGLLAHLGKKTRDAAIYWKYGSWFWEQTTRSQVMIQSAYGEGSGGDITIKAWGGQPRLLVDAVLKRLLALSTGQPPEVRLSWEADTSDADESRDGGAAKLVVPIHPDRPKDETPEILISYAWGDDETRQGQQRREVVERLCQRLEEWGYHVVRDTDIMRAGDLVSDFMKRIGRGDHVIAILSQKYLRSAYCMTELHYIYERSLREKAEFLCRVIPLVLEDCKIDEWRERVAHVKYWRQEHEEMESNARDLGLEDLRLYGMVRRWHSDISDILAFIADKLSPRGFDAIVADNFHALRTMLPPR